MWVVGQFSSDPDLAQGELVQPIQLHLTHFDSMMVVLELTAGTKELKRLIW